MDDTPSESKSFVILSSSFQEFERIFSSSSKSFSASNNLRSTGGLFDFAPWYETVFLLRLFYPLMPSPLGPRHRVFSFIILQSTCLSIWSLKLFPICHRGSSTLVPTSPFVGSCISLHPPIPGCICRDFESHPSSSRMWAIRPPCWSPYVETIKVRTQPLSFSTHMAVHAFE